MLIDTHCHLDSYQFEHDRTDVIHRANNENIKGIVIPAVHPSNFNAVRELAHSINGGLYALGIHPMYVSDITDSDLQYLEKHIEKNIQDGRLVAVGEIGLDFFVDELCTKEMVAHQEHVYRSQLYIAKKYNLPVIMHVRRSQDIILKHLRSVSGVVGIAHAFNGSHQQANRFLDLGCVLGAGGAMTYERARQIRRLVSDLPDYAWVLETDAPDIPPAWLSTKSNKNARNEPAELCGILRVFSELRNISIEQAVHQTFQNACRILNLNDF